MLYFTTELNNSKIPPTFQEWDTSDLMEQHYLEHHGSSHPAVLTQASACTSRYRYAPFPADSTPAGFHLQANVPGSGIPDSGCTFAGHVASSRRS